MTGVWAVARRELFSLWVTPLAWLVLCAFLLMNGAAFLATISSLSTFGMEGIDVGPIQAYFGQSIFVPLGYVLVCPLLSMRTLAEERRTGTAELLLCSPISAVGIVVGKYLALSGTYAIMWLPTLLYPLILRDTGHVEWPVVATSYVGVVGLGCGFVSVGLLASAVTTNPLVAAILTSTLISLLLLCGVGEQLYQGGFARVLLSQLSIQSSLAECAQGILSVRRLTYLATLVILPQFLAVRAVERWRDG
jgi:ABC-2 type transport system permease protein